MNKNDSNLKNNLIKLSMFLSLVLLSAFLLMAAINMLNLPNAGAGGGEDKKESSSGENKKQPKAGSDFKDNDFESFDDWKDRVEKRREERKGSENFEGEYSYGEGQEGENSEDGENAIPENVPNIDISGDQTVPDIPFGSGESGQTIALSNEKQPHAPAFEVLGYPNYPFLKVMVMENYYNNHWTAIKEEPEVKINFDEKLDEKYSVNSVKIKPIVPSNGYLPVLSGNIDFKYRTSVNWYKKTETYYSEETVSDFYSMDYEDSPVYDQLIFSDTDDSYLYSISVPEEIDVMVDDIIKDCNSDYDIIIGVQNYLTDNYRLQSGIINNYGKNDGIVSFLMDKSGAGNSLDFISAYAYLLRAAGIPCRLVIGYKVNPELTYQVVYRDQAYIYPEIMFEEFGWVPMDVFGYDPSFTPPIETITKIASVSDEAKRGTSFTVKGTVEDTTGKILDNMSVLIYVKPSKTENTLSYVKTEVNDGHFEVTCDIKHSTYAGKYQVVADLLENDLYRTSTSDPEMRVTTDTFIELNTKDSVVGSSFKVEGRLVDSYSKEGILNQNIDVKFKNVDNIESTLSGEEGRFSQVVELKKLGNLSPERDFFLVKSYKIPYKLNFIGTDIFYPSTTDSSIYVWHILWLRIVLALLLLIIVIAVPVIINIVRRRRVEMTDVVLALDGNIQKPVSPFTEYVQADKKEIGVQISICFPQIKSGYPDIWGVNEEMNIRFEDSSQNWDEIKNIFIQKGVYGISVSEGIGKIAKRNIKIVDYREEVIENGKKLLKEFSPNIEINDKMTLREILLLTKSELTTMKYMILEQIFVIMEKAVYSLSDITRDDYELFYMCIQKYRATKG